MENITLDKIKVKDSWDQVTISEFVQIKQILESPNYDDLEKELRVIAVLSGQEDFRVFDNVLKRDAERLFSSIAFLNEEPKGDIQDIYTINGTEYRLIKTIYGIQAGPWRDFSHYIEDKEQFFNNLTRICTVFLRPTRPLKGFKRLNNRLVNYVNRWEKGAAFASKLGLKQYLPDTEDYLETPIGETETNLFFHMPVSVCMGIICFFLIICQMYGEHFLAYSEKTVIQSVKSALTSLKQTNNPKSLPYTERAELVLQSIMDGSPLPTDLQEV